MRDPKHASHVLAGLDEIEVGIEKLVAGGEGLARVDGVPIFVPRAAPGDRLRVRLTQRRPDYGRAEIVEILEPGPGRRPAPCAHFGRCGGCDLQHLEDEIQPKLKVEAALETLRRLGGLGQLPSARLVVGRPWGYRLRTQLRTETDGDTVRVGYFARGSHELIAIEECPVLAPELEAEVLALGRRLSPGAPSRLDVAIGEDGRASYAPVVEGLPRGAVERRVGELTFALDARTFFQTHGELLRDLCEAVVGPWTGEHAFDLYAGVGLFSLPLAARYARVTAIEAEPVAARYARRNLRPAANAEIVVQSIESWIPELPADVERVVVDPPRSGLSRRVRGALRRLLPQRLTYLSCHPAALARDLASLVDRYEVESVEFFDLFPQTGHLETLVQLTRRPD